MKFASRVLLLFALGIATACGTRPGTSGAPAVVGRASQTDGGSATAMPPADRASSAAPVKPELQLTREQLVTRLLTLIDQVHGPDDLTIERVESVMGARLELRKASLNWRGITGAFDDGTPFWFTVRPMYANRELVFHWGVGTDEYAPRRCTFSWPEFKASLERLGYKGVHVGAGPGRANIWAFPRDDAAVEVWFYQPADEPQSVPCVNVIYINTGLSE